MAVPGTGGRTERTADGATKSSAVEKKRAKGEGSKKVAAAPPKDGFPHEAFTWRRPFSSGDLEAQQDLWHTLSQQGRRVKSPIVQFSSFIYYVMENEPFMSMEVMRIGDLNERSSVGFRTRDATAKAGIQYISTSGTLVFEAGENTAVIKVPLEVSVRWDTTLEFVAELVHTRLDNAIPGRYLWQARIKIIQVRGDCFPTDRFAVEITRRRFDKVPANQLFLEYCKMNSVEPKVRRGTLKLMALDALCNLYGTAVLVLLLYAFCVILGEADAATAAAAAWGSRGRKNALVFIASAILLPLPVLQFLKVRICRLQVDGLSRNLLQKNLLRRFLNFTDRSRGKLREGDLLLTMTRDVELLVGNGYMNVMPFFSAACQLFLSTTLQFVFSPALGEALRWDAALPLLLFPLTLLLALRLGHKRTCRLLERQGCRMDKLCRHVGDTASNYPLIADYNQRPFFVELHEAKVVDYNNVATAVQQAFQRRASLMPLLANFLLCLRLIVGGMQVIDGTLISSHLMADLLILGCVGKATSDLHMICLDIQRCFTALLRLVTILNLQIDIDQRLQVNRCRRDETGAMRAEARKKLDPNDFEPIDSLPIRVTNLDFTFLSWAFHRHGNEENLVAPLRFEGSIDIPQGQLVVLVGPQGEGKSTLLRLIADMITQETNHNIVFVPSHLRVLHVNCDALFFHGSLYENMTFGVRLGDSDGRLERVLSICARLGLGDSVLEALQIPDVCEWGSVICETKQTLLSLARALIANPEVLCIHKPTEGFDKHTANIVLGVLQDFVRERGIEEDPATRHLRRPRTCIITSSRRQALMWADQLLHVSSAHGVVQVRGDEVLDAELL